MQDKDYFVEGVILFIYLILVVLFFVAIVATSYGFLYALNYIVTTYPEVTSLISQPSANIEIHHVLLTSVLLSICCIAVFKFDENYGDLIKGLYKSNASNLSVISEQLYRIDENTKEINEILEHVNTIESTMSFEISDIKNNLEKIQENTTEIKDSVNLLD